MRYIIVLILVSFAAVSGFSSDKICSETLIVDKVVLKKISQYIDVHPVKNNILTQDQIKVGQIITNKENEFTQINLKNPFKVDFQVYPESTIEVLSLGDKNCGPQIKLLSGRIRSVGNHPLIPDPPIVKKSFKKTQRPQNPVAEKCPFEIETEEAYIQPVGTTYLVESGALSDAVAELNGETTKGSNLVGVGQSGTIEESSFEKYSSQKGVIKIKLKKISKNKFRNKLKYAKLNNNKKSKSKKLVAKNSKAKIKYLAYNEKIKLKAGASLSVKRKLSSKKTQTAELEIFDPSGI